VCNCIKTIKHLRDVGYIIYDEWLHCFTLRNLRYVKHFRQEKIRVRVRELRKVLLRNVHDRRVSRSSTQDGKDMSKSSRNKNDKAIRFHEMSPQVKVHVRN